MDIQLIGNSNKLVQVFDNLIDNSLSIIGRNCKINIRAFSRGKKIFILFEDNGPGFPKNAINKIFDRFYTDRIVDRDQHSGLGLSISYEIINSFNGSIELTESDKLDFRGACFLIKLPLKSQNNHKRIQS